MIIIVSAKTVQYFTRKLFADFGKQPLADAKEQLRNAADGYRWGLQLADARHAKSSVQQRMLDAYFRTLERKISYVKCQKAALAG